jgi:DNA ligase (NAD+)
VAAQSIIDYAHDEHNKAMIKELDNVGVNMNYLGPTVRSDSFFSNKTVVLTGTLEKYGRREATEMLENLGAHVSGSVSKATDVVIYGSEAGSKLDKAQKLGVLTMDEDEFISHLGM